MRRPRKNAVGVVVTAAMAAGMFSGCAATDLAACSQAFERAALTVDKVVSAEFECEESLGDSSQRGKIVLAVDTQESANPVIEDVYRAFAAEPDLDDSWLPNIEFAQESSESHFSGLDVDLDFNGKPNLRDMREGYDINPTGADRTRSN